MMLVVGIVVVASLLYNHLFFFFLVALNNGLLPVYDGLNFVEHLCCFFQLVGQAVSLVLVLNSHLVGRLRVGIVVCSSACFEWSQIGYLIDLRMVYEVSRCTRMAASSARAFVVLPGNNAYMHDMYQEQIKAKSKQQNSK